MRGRALPVVFALLFAGAAHAQVIWQPTAPPLVTAENEAWYHAGTAIEWNGDFYYPAGAPEAFNGYQMARSGSYRGIPLYTDTTLEPYSIVFVPIGGGRMQPYERPRNGMLAGSVGSRAPSFPIATQPAAGLGITTGGFVAQAPGPPTFARGYDIAPTSVPAPGIAASPVVPATTGTAGTTEAGPARPAATTGQTTTVTNRPSGGAHPKSIDNVWLNYNGRRWVSAGRAVDVTPDFTRIGDYRGFPVYQRQGDPLTIYIPSGGDLAVPFKPAGR